MRPEAGQHDVCRQADAEQSLGLSSLRLAPAPIVGQLERAIEPGRVVAAVIDDWRLGGLGAHVPGKFVGSNEVLATHLGRVQPELLGEAVDDALGREYGLGLTGAAIRRGWGFVGQGYSYAAVVVVEAIGAG